MAKILYVEDNDDNVYMLAARLRRRGFEVIVASDGEQGVALACAEAPALILMDLGLPILDGWEATRRLKAAPETRSIPIIALSAHAMASDRETGRSPPAATTSIASPSSSAGCSTRFARCCPR